MTQSTGLGQDCLHWRDTVCKVLWDRAHLCRGSRIWAKHLSIIDHLSIMSLSLCQWHIKNHKTYQLAKTYHWHSRAAHDGVCKTAGVELGYWTPRANRASAESLDRRPLADTRFQFQCKFQLQFQCHFQVSMNFQFWSLECILWSKAWGFHFPKNNNAHLGVLLVRQEDTLLVRHFWKEWMNEWVSEWVNEWMND